MLATNYYKTLHVLPDCSQNDIKKSYRKLALCWHPDKTPNNPQEVFKKIGEAYETLSDPGKRSEYDRCHSSAPSQTQYNSHWNNEHSDTGKQ